MSVNIYFLAALIGVIIGVLTLYGSMKKSQRDVIDEVVSSAMHKVMESVIDPLDRRVTVVETKMEVFWREIAGDMAKVLHHPEPSRARIDYLLDTLTAGTLTFDECKELSGYLETIRDWEPGTDAPFRIFPGEQVAAAILLHTMGHIMEVNRSNDGEADSSGSRGEQDRSGSRSAAQGDRQNCGQCGQAI